MATSPHHPLFRQQRRAIRTQWEQATAAERARTTEKVGDEIQENEEHEGRKRWNAVGAGWLEQLPEAFVLLLLLLLFFLAVIIKDVASTLRENTASILIIGSNKIKINL